MKLKCVLIPFFIIGIISCSGNLKKDSKTSMSNREDTIASYVKTDFFRHQQFSDMNFTTEKQWDSLNSVVSHSKPASQYRFHKDYKTFGWHLYTKGSVYKSYNFSLLWGISYFSYVVNPNTGNYKDIHQWKTTALVDSAKAHNCKVFLSVSSFGEKNNATLLNNPKAKNTLIDSLTSLVRYRSADGINIDIEGVAAKDKQVFNDFVITLSKKLKNDNPDYMVSIALYAVDYHKIFDIKSLNPYIDFYTLMGYDYYGGFSRHAGPVSPLKSSKIWGENSIETSVNYYLEQGVSNDKLIVGFPYYGAKWETRNTDIPGQVKKFVAHDEYDIIKRMVDSMGDPIQYDPISSSGYIVYNQKGATRQLWFDDSLSLSIKYDWVKKNKLSGIGVWALGYDHGDTALWELMAAKFGQKDSL